jgi:hypothetical protein
MPNLQPIAEAFRLPVSQPSNRWKTYLELMEIQKISEELLSLTFLFDSPK